MWPLDLLNRPYRLFTFDPMASFPCLPVLARQACAWRLHLMFPARICCFLILSPITNLSLNVLCTKHEDWCHTKTRLLGQKWINGKVYCFETGLFRDRFASLICFETKNEGGRKWTWSCRFQIARNRRLVLIICILPNGRVLLDVTWMTWCLFCIYSMKKSLSWHRNFTVHIY